jgi:hypothetical protein
MAQLQDEFSKKLAEQQEQMAQFQVFLCIHSNACAYWERIGKNI